MGISPGYTTFVDHWLLSEPLSRNLQVPQSSPATDKPWEGSKYTGKGKTRVSCCYYISTLGFELPFDGIGWWAGHRQFGQKSPTTKRQKPETEPKRAPKGLHLQIINVFQFWKIMVTPFPLKNVIQSMHVLHCSIYIVFHVCNGGVTPAHLPQF